MTVCQSFCVNMIVVLMVVVVAADALLKIGSRNVTLGPEPRVRAHCAARGYTPQGWYVPGQCSPLVGHLAGRG